MATDAQTGLEECVKALCEAAENFPRFERGRWQISDKMLGRDPVHGNHYGHYKVFLEAFIRNINLDPDAFDKRADDLIKLSRYMGVYARFRADAQRPDSGVITQKDLDEAVQFARDNCKIMRDMLEARLPPRPEDNPRLMEIWCQ